MAAMTRQTFRARLMGTSLTVLSLLIADPAKAGMASAAFFAQITARNPSTATGNPATATALPIPLVAQQIAQRTQADLARAVSSVTAAAAAQALALVDATNAATAIADGTQADAGAVPTGLLPGLIPCTVSACGVGGSPADATKWQGADLPTSVTAGGTTTVTVTQTSPKAIATWQSFNVGKNTVLNFDQSAGTDQSGNNAWVVLNRVDDPATQPSQIAGAIQAKGSVYIINRNGVIFHGTAQVDVHALIASTLDIGAVGQSIDQRNAQFLQNGLNIPTGVALSQLGSGNVSFSQTGDAAAVLVDTATPAVQVDAGARISASVFPSDNPGSVMLLGATVSNAGQITAPAGQVIMAASRAVAFQQNTTVNIASGANYLGLVPVTEPSQLLSSLVVAGDSNFGRTWHGDLAAVNTGLIETPRGNITLVGTTVVNDGVLAATTSITRNGSIVLQGATAATLGPDSLATILPDENGETIPVGQASGTTVPVPYLTVQAAEIGDTSARTAVSGVGALTLAGSGTDGPGAMIVAPGATVPLFGGASILDGSNAVLDASGLTTGAMVSTNGAVVAALPMADNFVTFKPLGPEFANSPLQRSGVLRGQAITVDIRASGTTSDGIAWVGTPVANASGYVNTQVTESIDQLLTNGGAVTLATAASIPIVSGAQLDSIVIQPGASVDVSGGYLSYTGGYNQETYLLGQDGKLYPVSRADPSVTYVGLAGSFVLDHAHWGISNTWSGGIASSGSQSYEAGYIVGGNGGSITLFADAIEADGQLYGQASAGPNQRTAGQIPTSGTLKVNSAPADPTIAQLDAASSVSTQWVLLQKSVAATLDSSLLVSQTNVGDIEQGYQIASLRPTDRADTLVLSTDMIDAGGFGSVSVSGSTLVAADAMLTVANGGPAAAGNVSGEFLGGGGTIKISGPEIDIEGVLSAASGSVQLNASSVDPMAPANSAAITVGDTAIIDVRGRWINDSGTIVGSALGSNYINGGTISLTVAARAVNATVGVRDASTGVITQRSILVDTTGGIVIATPAHGAGPQLLASSGGYIGTNGKIQTVNGATGVPLGVGGSVTLATYSGGFTPSNLNNPFPEAAFIAASTPSALYQDGIISSDEIVRGVLSASVLIDPARSISANGFAAGGTFKLSVGPSILIADASVIGDDSEVRNSNGLVVVSSDFFGTADNSYRNPFSTIDLESDQGAVTIAGEVDTASGRTHDWTLELQQAVLQSTPALNSLASYSSLSQLSTTTLAQYQSTPTNLTLGPAQRDSQFFPANGLVSGSLVSAAPDLGIDYSVEPGSTVIGPGVIVSSAPNRSVGATITLNSTFLTAVQGKISAPAGNIVIEATGITQSGSARAISDGQVVGNGVVILAPGSLIDASGIFVSDPVDSTLLANGQEYSPSALLSGGRVTLQATADNGQTGATDSFGYILQQPGSIIDIGGATASVQVLQQNTNGQSATLQTLYSDAGSVTFDAVAGAVDGTIEAQGGGGARVSTAANGIFFLSSSLTANVLINQAGMLADGTTATTAGIADFLNSADQNHAIAVSSTELREADFDDINIGQIDQTGSLHDIGTIRFDGNVDLSSRRSILLEGPISETNATDRVSVSTAYLTLTTADSSLIAFANTHLGTFSASTLDIVLQRGAIDAGSVSLNATNDIVVSSVAGSRTVNFGGGGLVTTGDLELTAQRLYTMGGAEGVIQSLGPGGNDGKLTILTPAGPSNDTLPLTAGGTLYLLASKIDQEGVVEVPGGTIVLGNANGEQFFTFDGPLSVTPAVTAAATATLGSGSITSVSLGGDELPYGGTVDQVSWYYADPTRSQTPLSAPPAKSIQINAKTISLAGATGTKSASVVDISGGGDLYAAEFIAGNGGSANVLSASNTYTSTSFSPTILGNIALYNNVLSPSGVSGTYNANLNSTSQVYAIVPLGENPSISPSDLDFATYASPAANPGTEFGNPTPAMGLSIILNGAKGMADGTYTLLPAYYATLPGAYRVVIVPGSSNFQAAANTVLPDGTIITAATVTTALAPSRKAVEVASLPIAVELQSRAVWEQYSNIAITGANTFFPQQTAAGATVPRLPIDAGSLDLAAGTALNLDGTLSGSATSGLASVVAITATNLQVLASDRGAEANGSYVIVDATQITDLGAGSLLLGGTETTGSTGVALRATAQNVEITTDAAHPLAAPEIVIVTKGSASATLGLAVDADAVLEVTGPETASTATRTFVIGSIASKIIGDGAFLAISNSTPIILQRTDLPSPNANRQPIGTITIGEGAIIAGGNDLVIDASDAGTNSTIDATAQLYGRHITLSGSAISLGNDGTDGLLVPAAVVSQLLGAQSLTLQGVGGGNGGNSNGLGDIEFAGVDTLALTTPGAILTLDGTALSSFDGQSIVISASTVNIQDTHGTGAYMPSSAPATLSISAGTIDFGAGSAGLALDQFDTIDLSASAIIEASGALSVQAADAAVSLSTPEVLASAGSNLELATTGLLSFEPASGNLVQGGSALGGSLNFKGGSVWLGTELSAPSGNITIEATSGDVTLAPGASILAQGYSEAFFNVVNFADGGNVTITADHGSVSLAPGAGIRVDAAAEGGNAGTVTLAAPDGAVALDGSFSGLGPTVGAGRGGSIAINQSGAVDLTALAMRLSATGFDTSITVTAGSGDLVLSSGMLDASTVSLVAQAGAIVIGAGTGIDASGSTGGSIDLLGQDGVDIEGFLRAKGSSSTETGGTVEIGIGASRDTANPLNPTYGYENENASGTVTLGAASLIDVSGGSLGGNTGGTVTMIAPLLESGMLPVSFAPGATILGSYNTRLEAYAQWRTSDMANQPSTALRFDGIVDPAGIETGSGDHVGFYGQTLLGFVQNFAPSVSLSAGLGTLHVLPGIDLINDTPGINSGDITVASAWNLGAGGYDSQGNLSLYYRTPSGEPGILTLRAVNNVNVQADLTDGFFQSSNKLDINYQKVVGNTYLALAAAGDSTKGVYATPFSAPTAPYDTTDATYTLEYGTYLATYKTTKRTDSYADEWSTYRDYLGGVTYLHNAATPTPTTTVSLPLAPQLDDPASYGDAGRPVNYTDYLNFYQNSYLANYANALGVYAGSFTTAGQVFEPPAAPASPDAPSAADGSSTGAEYTAYLSNYLSGYLSGYKNYLTTVRTLALNFPHSATNADGSDQLYVAPIAPVAPVAWGSEIGTALSTFNGGSASGLYGANGISPNATANDPNPVMAADLVPQDAVAAAGGGHALSQGSWSFRIVGGADAGSVDPLAVASLGSFSNAGQQGSYTAGTVTLSGHGSYQLVTSIQKALVAADPTLTQGALTALVPTIIRTGTGTIDVAAGTDIVLADTLAPGAIYTAGVESAALPSPGYQAVDGGAAINGPGSKAALSSSGGTNFFGDGLGTTSVADPSGFQAPDFGNSFILTSPTMFAVTTPAYPEGGGAITLVAQDDIIGVENIPAAATYSVSTTPGYLAQYWSNWLLDRSAPIPGLSSLAFNADQGLYNPDVSRSASSDLTDGQTTWWINFGSFDQGAATLGGGNLTVKAGHDIRQFSASTASTGRVSGGLDATALPVLHVTGGGNLVVTAGNDILAGAYYVALGTGMITAGGSVTADKTWHYTYKDSKATPSINVRLSPSTVFGVGDAALTIQATGSIDIGDIVNPTEIIGKASLIVGDDAIADNGGASSMQIVHNTELVLASAPFNTMTQSSAVSVTSTGGEVSFLTLPSGTANRLYQTSTRLLPATVTVTALTGDVQVDSSFNMSNSLNGTLNIYAAGNLRLVGADNQLGSDPTATIMTSTAGEAPIATYQTGLSQTVSTIDPIPGLIDTQFDPLNPAADYSLTGSAPFQQTAGAQYLLLHTSGEGISHLYALAGNLTNGIVIGDPTVVPTTALTIPVLTDMPIEVQAGQDILNLQLYAQNTQSTDVTTIIAGRDLTYNLPTSNLAVLGTNNNGQNLIELAGPGDLVVEAGRNLGPFPSNFNTGPSGIMTTGAYDWLSGTINPKLSSIGASIFASAGVAGGTDATAQIATYLDPAQATNDAYLGISYALEYEPQLLVYLRQLSPAYVNLDQSQAFADFTALSSQQQQVFLNQVFFSQLQTTQSAPDILPELLGFEASHNLLGYSLSEIYGLYSNGASALGRQIVTQAYTVFAGLSPTLRQDFVTEIATDTSTQAPNIWHAYALLEGLSASERQRYVAATSPAEDLAYIEALTPDQRQALVHNIGTIALNEIPSIWSAPGYTRGYQIIDTVFPGTYGYTVNRLSGGLGAAPGTLVETGNIDLRSATIQTQHGGSIEIFAPGGNVLLGSTAARTIYNQPGSTGLLTFQGGAIDVFADQSLIVNQSRILTEEGGDVLTWSSNADILAGSGAKTSADFPPYSVLYDADGLQSLNAAGLVTGAGIGALVTVNNQDPTQSNDYFMTPVGTVDAGDAGLRAAGNIVVAAAHVANAANISVGGKSTGVPTVAAVNVGALASAGSAAGAAAHAADNNGLNKKSGGASGQSIITIDVLGFGGGDVSGDQADDQQGKKRSS